MEEDIQLRSWHGVVPDWLQRQALTRGVTVAIENASTRWTYAELLDKARKVAVGLKAAGIHPGDRVALLARRGSVFALAVHALIQGQMVLVPSNTRLTPAELAWQWQDAGVGAVLYDNQHATVVQDVMQAAGLSVWHWNLEESFPPVLDGQLRTSLSNSISLREIHAVVYTSGTTGRPKGTLITYGNHLAGAMASAQRLGLNLLDRWLVPMPLFHVGGLAVLMRSLIYGTTAVIHDEFDPVRVNEEIDKGHVDLLSVVPTMLLRMLDAHGEQPYQGCLRTVLLGGSAAPSHLVQRCLKVGLPVAQSYGLTEANSQVATLAPEDALKRPGCSGQPLLFTELAILQDGRVAEPGQEGEIVVRGPTVTPGYYGQPVATAETLQDGWLHTGDMGLVDSDGYLYVLDRRRDLIVSGGENIYPAEVERVLTAHPAVQDAAVVGVAHAQWGQVPVAFVVVAARDASQMQIRANELQDFCRTRLAAYKIPQKIYFVDALPRNVSGKLMRKEVQRWLQ